MEHLTPSSTAKGQLATLNILLAAEELFLTRGYHGTSMRDIAEKAGYKSVAGIYNHFREKEDIFRTLLEARAPSDALDILIRHVRGETLQEFLPNLFYSILQLTSQNPSYLQLILIDYLEFKGEHIHQVVARDESISQAMLERLKTFPDRPAHLEPTIILRTFQLFFFGYQLTRFMTPPAVLTGESEAEWQARLLNILLTGLIYQKE